MYIIILDYNNKDAPVSICKLTKVQQNKFLKRCMFSDCSDYLGGQFWFDSSNCHWMIIPDEKLTVNLNWIQSLEYLNKNLNKNLKSITIS